MRARMILKNLILSLRSTLTTPQLFFTLIDKQKHGPSFWKFNARLTDDNDFVTLINESVLVWLNEFDEVTGKRLLGDLIKYSIRQVSKKYSKVKFPKASYYHFN